METTTTNLKELSVEELKELLNQAKSELQEKTSIPQEVKNLYEKLQSEVAKVENASEYITLKLKSDKKQAWSAPSFLRSKGYKVKRNEKTNVYEITAPNSKTVEEVKYGKVAEYVYSKGLKAA